MAGSELLVLNPRHRRRRRTRRAKATTKRRRRRRVRVMHHNPRVRSRRRRSHVRRRRTRRTHNPGGRILGVNVGQVAMLATGGIVTEVLADKLAKMIPAGWNLDANMARIGAKAAIGVGVPLLGRKFLPRGWGNAIAIGGGIVTLLDFFKTYVAPKIPGLTLSSYELGPTTVNAGFSDYEQLQGMGDDIYADSVYQ